MFLIYYSLQLWNFFWTTLWTTAVDDLGLYPCNILTFTMLWWTKDISVRTTLFKSEYRSGPSRATMGLGPSFFLSGGSERRLGRWVLHNPGQESLALNLAVLACWGGSAQIWLWQEVSYCLGQLLCHTVALFLSAVYRSEGRWRGSRGST